MIILLISIFILITLILLIIKCFCNKSTFTNLKLSNKMSNERYN